MAKILVTGASGLLGSNLVYEATYQHDVIAVSHSHALRYERAETVMADLSLPENADLVIGQYAPEWVIHCAAETNIDRCERDPDRAFRLNRDMARWVARATRASGGRFIYISTDAVFDGSGSGYSEEDIPQPNNIYSQSKLEGERVVYEEDPRAMIVRTNFFGWNAVDKKSLAEWFLEHLEEGRMCRGFTDVFVKLLLVNDLVDILLKMLENECEGIFHVVGKDCVSKYHFGLLLAEVFHLDRQWIQPIEVEQVGLIAPRARNLCLDTTKISNALGIDMPSLENGLRRFYALEKSGYPETLKSLIGERNHEGN
jgi:dTDP-4-dehydrorhamnose reductase